MLTTPQSLQYIDFLSFVSTKQYTKKVGTMMFPQIAKLNFYFRTNSEQIFSI
jgi:hypothetical protein